MNKIYKALLGIVLLSLISISSKAQLAGTYSVPATFPSIAAAINSLNIGGITGSVTILIDAGYTETAPVGGYTLTASGTALNPIIFQKNGVGFNPVINAYTGGTGTPGTAFQDGVFRLIGSDYITFDGIDISDGNLSNPSTMEFGYGFFKASVTDGCQNNTIQNCVITLNRVNNAAGTTPAVDGSRGIDVVNAATGAHTTPLTITTAQGANSNNRFYSNIIQNCNIGISLIGFVATTPFTTADQNNDIGGISAVTGNTIINYGGGAGAANPAAAVRTSAQYSLNVSYNTINNNNGAGVNHINVLRGIFIGPATSANATINNNTVTVRSGATLSALTAIENASGATAASNLISISNNLITNCTYSTATTGGFTGIVNSASTSTLSVINNSIVNNSTNATSGSSNFLISNTGAVASAINLNSNSINGFTFAAANTGALAYIINTGISTPASLSISNNSFQAISHAVPASSGHTFIRNNAATFSQDISNNRFINLLLNTTGSVIFITNDVALPAGGFVNANNNAIVTGFNKTGAGGSVGIYVTSTTPSSPSGTTKTHQNNNFSNITLTGATTMTGWMDLEGAIGGGSTKLISSNTFTNWSCGSGAVTVIQTNWNGANTSVSSNTISNISGSGAITGISRGASGGGSGTEIVSNNIITGFNSLAPGGAINGLTGGTSGIATYSVFNNTIGSFSTVGASVTNGISLSSVASSNVYKNKIYDLESNNASGSVNGINVVSGTTHNIFNNLIGDLRAPSANAANPLIGINVSGGTTSNVFYNTVQLNATSSSALFGSSALFASTTPNLNLRNNIFINLSTPNGLGLTSAYRRSTTTLTSYSASSNNNIFYAGVPGASNLVFFDGTNAIQSFTAYQTFVSPRDAASYTENTTFLSVVGTSTNFLHVDPTIPSNTESGAVNIAGITDDFDANIRQGNIGYTGAGNAPDIGADEYDQNLPPCNAVTAATINPTSVTKCAGETQLFNATGVTQASGIVKQWQVGTTPGGPYNNVVGGVGPNSNNYTTAGLNAGVFYYIMLTTCTVSGNSAISNEATVTVNAVPALTVSPQTSTICMPGGSSVTINVSGGNNYTWTPGAINNSSISVLPGSTTIYSVIAVNLAGCTSTATSIVYIAENPTLTSVTASPTLICPGSSSTLQALASSSAYVVSSIQFSPIPTPTAGLTVLQNAGVDITGLATGDLDDGYWTNLSIPFSFNFFGINYTSFAVGTNGNITLGPGNPNTNDGYANTFPSLLAPRPSIAAVLADLNCTTGTVNTFTTGVAPNRQVVVNWSGVRYYLATGTVIAQAIINESSNNIDIHITTATGWNSSVEGIQNAAGTIAYTAPGRNNTNFVVSTPDAYRFSPVTMSYSWSPASFLNNVNINNPVANTVTSTVNYSVNVLASNGCSLTGAVTLSTDIGPTVSIAGGTAAVCAGSTVNLTASGADTYSWNAGPITSSIAVNPTVTTTYTVVGTSTLNSCTDVEVKTITVNPTPSVVVTGSATICMGQSVGLVASGASTYSWSNGSTLSVIAPSPTTTTNYTVVGTSTAGCNGTTIKSVSVNALPSVTVSASPSQTICTGENVTLIASGTGVDTYSWNTGANSAITVVSPTVNTSYTMNVGSNLTGCSNTATLDVTVRLCVGIEENNMGISGLSLYPNPNSGVFIIELENENNKTIEVSDVTGRFLINKVSDEDKTRIDMQEFANGIYYVKVITGNSSQVFKIIKQ